MVVIFNNGLMTKLLAIIVLMTFTAESLPTDDWGSYKPAYSLGSGTDNWWISYPDQNKMTGSSVKHPQWVLDTIKEKPVLILDHTTYCKSCIEQKANIEKALISYGKEINYYDIVADGSDQRAYQVLNVYSPTGEKQYVPTTVLVTLIKGPDGKVAVSWHSAVDAMSEEDLNSYLKDAIYYHRKNSPDWSM